MKEGWEYKIFESCLVKVPKQVQIKSKDYKKEGKFPIVSQEAELISGYWDDDTIVYKHKEPVVIFGDHTKNIKYVDFNFVVGADGTHILSTKKDINPKFFYYVLKSIKLRELGYARHYKLLKEKYIPVPPLSEQQSIVDYLDSAFAKIDAMKANAEKALNEAKALFQASLKEMLEPKDGWEEKTINDVAFFRNGIAHEKDIEDSGDYVVINSKFVATGGTIRKYSNEQLSPLYINEIVMVMSDVPKGKTLAKCYIIECNNKYSLNQRICAFKSKGLDVKFLYYLLNRNPHLLKYDNGENQTNLRKKQILECPLTFPSQKNEQQRIVICLDSLKSKVDRLQENYDKISQECDALKQAILRQVFE